MIDGRPRRLLSGGRGGLGGGDEPETDGSLFLAADHERHHQRATERGPARFEQAENGRGAEGGGDDRRPSTGASCGAGRGGACMVGKEEEEGKKVECTVAVAYARAG
eukprot:scaffold7879_cov103-Isochrysis_galbana.AAC.1